MGLYDFLDNKRTLWIFVGLVVILIIITYFTAGVSRQVTVQGKVWEWVNAPEGAAGTVYAWEKPSEEAENWVPAPGIELKPLHGAYIRFEAVYKGRQREKGLAISRQDGYFSKRTSNWGVSGDIAVSLNATREGYSTVYATFTNKGDPNYLHIILVRAE
jgi:hypothetical protein